MTFPTPKKDALRIQRGRAIEAYARVEQQLADLFSDLLGIHPRLGGVVFFKITNANARDKILETLLKKHFGETYPKYRVYWHGDDKGGKGLFHHLRSITQDRNSIVHWAEANFIAGVPNEKTPNIETGEWALMPPNWWDWGDGIEKPNLNVNDLHDFVAKTHFVQQAIFMFHAYTFDRSPPANKPTVASWQEIFSHPCSYPPPESHPSFARWEKLASERQPSQA